MSRAEMTISQYGRGECPVCGRDIALTKKGFLRVHNGDIAIGGRATRCHGIGLLPMGAAR
jgi:hypothetical protein